MRIQLQKILGLVTASALLSSTAFADDYPPPDRTTPPVIVTPAPPPAVVVPPANVYVTPPAPAPAPSTIVVNPQPRNTEVTHPYGVALIGGGAALLGITYTATAITAGVTQGNNNCNANTSSLGCPTRYWPMYVPVAGPFIQMGSMTGRNSQSGKALLAVDGGLQAVGAALLVTGVIESLAARPAGVRETYTQKPAKKGHFLVSPFASATGAGFGAAGSF